MRRDDRRRPRPPSAGPEAPIGGAEVGPEGRVEAASRALLTGFGPFGRWTVNSSGDAVRRLAGGRDSRVRVLPVDHHAAPAALDGEFDGELDAGPVEVLLLTGLASERRPRLELRARRPAHRAEGPETLAGVWPWAEALAAMRAAGAPARLSTDAGRYVCETTYWAALARRAEGRGPRLIAFLHVPPLSDAWPVERVAAAIRACLDAGKRAAGLDRSPGAA